MGKLIGALFLMVFTVIGCSKFGGDVELVKTGYLDYDKSISVGQAFDGYKYFLLKIGRH